MRLVGGAASALRRRRVRFAGGRWDTRRQRGDRGDTGSGDGAEHQRRAQHPRHAWGHVVAEHPRPSPTKTITVAHQLHLSRFTNMAKAKPEVLSVLKQNVVAMS
jgi:hypothetical protein